ncbi:hypothetical protein OA40_16395 [Morganella morganii]|uniref:hypothetical protein n=1 Tax=Morganella morganii TaxID=582 RepID=UPI00062C762C|nr:hypothetical protein [Morganella morganii]EKV4236478.1 hypothetical protein [Morganella morganii]ELL8928683.1 hypothetical protein [Morganella morganii]EMB6209879.1 hypothetical protein [Morganella morganii]KKY64230.1 hypothetical protein OA40_16395 [Morganella morganii]
MSGQSNYLPAGLPHNRALWPVEYQEKEQLDLAASRMTKLLRIFFELFTIENYNICDTPINLYYDFW